MKLSLKIIASLLNILSFQCFFFIGLGQSFYGNLKKALVLTMTPCLIFLFSGLTGLMGTFTGFIISYSLGLGVCIWAILEPFFVKKAPVTKHKWHTRIFVFIVAAIIIHLATVFPIRKYFYSPYSVPEKMRVFEEGDYVMIKNTKDVSKDGLFVVSSSDDNGYFITSAERVREHQLHDFVVGQILYIFWSKDYHRIGKKLD